MADAEAQATSDAIRSAAAASREATGDKPDDKPKEEATVTVTHRDSVDIDDIAAQADKPDAVKRALQAEREEAAAARKRAEAAEAKVQEYADRDKSEQQKLEEKATRAETRASNAEARLERIQVAIDKELPLDLADRLQGKNRKELEEDAERLLDLVKPNGRPQGDVDAGKGEGGEGTSFNDLLRAGRV